MKLKEIMTSCIKGAKEEQEEYPSLIQERKTAPSNVYYTLGQKNEETEITLENLTELKGEEKESFLRYVISNNKLHEINKKIAEHALGLVDSNDLAFLLRIPKNAIFRDLFYLEAKKNNFTVKVNEEGTLVINFPSGVLELYKLLVSNFYSKKFKEKEVQEKIYKELCSNPETPFEKLSEWFIDSLEKPYIEKSLAQSIMCLFVSKYIREHDVCEELFKLDRFKKALELNKFKALGALSNSSEEAKAQFNTIVVDDVLNDVKGVYINNLAASNILNLIMYSSSNNETIESIEILGDTMTFSTLV